jgi:hypothetical protein
VPQSSNLVFHAIALERRLLSKEALDKALDEAERRGRPIERHLVETGVLASDVSRTVEVARAKQARACTTCRKLTYLAPNADLASLPCEHCGGVLAPPAPPPAPLPARAAQAPPPAAPAAPPPPTQFTSHPRSGPASGSQIRPTSGSTSGPGSGPGSTTTSVKVTGAQGSTIDSSPGQATPRGGAMPRPAPGTTTPRGGSMPRPAPGTTTPRGGSMPRPAPGTTTPRSGSMPRPAAPAQAPGPAPKSGPQPKPPAPAAGPRSSVQPKPAAPPPKSGPQPEPAAPAEPAASAPTPEPEDDGEEIPTWIGPCRVEAELGADETVIIYAARVGAERCAVRLLQPRLATSRRHVDAFFRSCQKAAVVGLEPLEVGLDERGAPFLAVKRTDDEDDPATALLALQADAASESSGHGSTSSDSNDALVFAQLNKQREQLQRQVAEASKRRERVVGSFVLLEKLGRDLGELWRGYDTGRNELCAVRVVEGFEPLTENGRLRKDLDDPLGAVQRMRHPNLVPPRDRGVDRGKLFVVRDLGAARPLLGGQSIQHVSRAVMGAAQALAYLHGQGLAHGGLHPGVVLVDGNGRGLLVDPGLAAVAAAAQALGPAWRLARVGCVAPESEGGVDSQAGDIHALGAVLYRACAEWLPETPPPPGAPGAVADPPNDALAVALRCLEKDPAARYASATDLAADLGRVVQGQVPAARTPRPAPAAPAAPKASGQVVERLTGMFKKLGKALGRDGSS